MKSAVAIPLLVLALALAACEEVTTPDPNGPEPTTLEVDATQAWVYVDLSAEAMVTVGDPATSDAWDLGFLATSVTVNGGAAGPGGVEGYCICQNSGASDADIVAMTADGELADFEGVPASAVPTDPADWESDALDPAIDGWYSYDPQTHVVSAQPAAVFLVKLRGGAFAKLHVTDIDGYTDQHAGTVAVEFAAQSGPGQPLGATVTLAVDASAGRAHLDLVAGALGTSASWDLALDGYTIMTNGGVSGDAGVGAVATTETFDDVTDPGAAPASVYQGDRFGGVFAGEPWYRYNLDGNNTIFPTFNVYLIRRGDEVWKLQIVNYYDVAGDPRHITFRYAPVD